MSKMWTEFRGCDTGINHKTGAVTKLEPNQSICRNNLYTVTVTAYTGLDEEPFKSWGKMVELSIRNNDRSARHDWRDFQRIKDDILGPEWWGFESYPAESNLVDTANQFYMFCFEKALPPWGFKERLVMDDNTDFAGAVQRPLDNPPHDAVGHKWCDEGRMATVKTALAMLERGQVNPAKMLLRGVVADKRKADAESNPRRDADRIQKP
jgi:hypothetical protein